LTPHVSVFELQCLLRVLNGAALSGVMPISQAILADAVESRKRGAAFGWMQALHTLARSLVSYSVLSLGDGWAYCYYLVFVLTLLVIALLHRFLPADVGKQFRQATSSKGELGNEMSFWSDAFRVIRKIVRIPTFVVLVLQGVAGGTPWQAMGFLNVFWASLGFETEQVEERQECLT
jgi:MFS family permease